MYQKSALSAADVKKIMAAAEAEATQNGWAVSIAVVDDGGHLLAMQRLDKAAPISS
ncbi:MAG TPA: heme-binding protein, partial [Burkholderiaceae bacterium]|nr:heme-binding protein [Burkholderiaceae bacterium]